MAGKSSAAIGSRPVTVVSMQLCLPDDRGIIKIAIKGDAEGQLEKILARYGRQKVIIIGMGEHNRSRFIQPFATFARLHESDEGSAVGQPTIEEVLEYLEKES